VVGGAIQKKGSGTFFGKPVSPLQAKATSVIALLPAIPGKRFLRACPTNGIVFQGILGDFFIKF
jgi:hypothetical protein